MQFLTSLQLSVAYWAVGQTIRLLYQLLPGNAAADAVRRELRICTWRGRAEGFECDWNHPDNWEDGALPDETSLVVVPRVAHHYYPNINQPVEPICSLMIERDAELLVSMFGELMVNGRRHRLGGIRNMGALNNFGELYVINAADTCILNTGTILNHGFLSLDRNGCDGLLTDDNSFVNEGELIHLRAE